MLRVWVEIKGLMNRLLDLESDRAPYDEITSDIEKNVEFRGASLWILIFAILVASVGLNMNSAAVVIGAMLISPLMGPIMGIGLGVGIYDFPLIKKSFRSLITAVVLSVLASALYFAITPLSDAQSELLSRTTPTLWDVLISFFGGMAGIVAATRKTKSQVIPGVAIATALMPPLCTAGYGLATLNLSYFIGAFYLFFINSVFISISSMIVIRFMKIPSKKWVDEAHQKRMRFYVFIVALITIIPSTYLGYDIVKRSVFKSNANRFIAQEFKYEDSHVVERFVVGKTKLIEIFLFGTPLPDEEIDKIHNSLAEYKIPNANLIIHQNVQHIDIPDMESVKSGILDDLYLDNKEIIKNKDNTIRILQRELSRYKNMEGLQSEIFNEIRVQYPEIEATAFNKMIINHKEAKTDTITMLYLDSPSVIDPSDLSRMEAWLKVRLKIDTLNIIQN